MNIVIWLQLQPNGGGAELLNPAVNVLNRLYGGINALGLIAPPGIFLDGVKSITKEDLKNLDYDLILVTGLNASLVPILKEAEVLGINPDKVVLDRTVCIPLFTLEKYNNLRRSQLSILSMNCWGGLIYNKLGLPFLSPTVNMVTDTENSFVKFLKSPIENMSKELKYHGLYYDEFQNTYRPVFALGEIEWQMPHNTAQETDLILSKWYERRYKINWLNTIAVMHTNNLDLLKEFDSLPFAKKVCFVPFETDIDSAFYLNPEILVKKYGTAKFRKIVNHIADDVGTYYNLWDILLYGKKTPLKIE